MESTPCTSRPLPSGRPRRGRPNRRTRRTSSETTPESERRFRAPRPGGANPPRLPQAPPGHRSSSASRRVNASRHRARLARAPRRAERSSRASGRPPSFSSCAPGAKPSGGSALPCRMNRRRPWASEEALMGPAQVFPPPHSRPPLPLLRLDRQTLRTDRPATGRSRRAPGADLARGDKLGVQVLVAELRQFQVRLSVGGDLPAGVPEHAKLVPSHGRELVLMGSPRPFVDPGPAHWARQPDQ